MPVEAEVLGRVVADVGQRHPAEVAGCRRLAETWAPVLHALASAERLLIALWLAGTACTVRELQDVAGLSQSLVSYHLRELRKAGLVTSAASGRAIGIACPTPTSTSWVCSSAAWKERPPA
jgi:predicted MarR family transcription regulator